MDFLLDISILLSYLLLYKYIALFVFVFLSAIGLPIPTNTILLAVGAFASQSYFDFGLSLFIAVIANILGDLFDYWIMRKYGAAILKKNYHKKFSFIIRLQPYIKSLEKHIENHEGLTIFLTRFVGTASMIVNFWSGLVPVSFKKFIFFDALGNFSSILLILSIGFFLGASWQNIAGIIGIAGTIISVVILVIFFALMAVAIKRRGKNNV